MRCYKPEDAALLKASIDESLEHLKPWMTWAMNEREDLEAKVNRMRKYRGQFDLGIDYVYGIFNPEETILIGSSGLHTGPGENAREIGYWINANHLNQGYATEVAKALTKVGFEIEELERIEIRCTSNNFRSQNVPKKLGYIHEATLRDRSLDSYGKKRDLMIWSMFREDYLNNPVKAIKVDVFDLVGNSINTF
ncbi:GNAT family N-acetyltransferase [Neolewinella agarilytica]|uniref:GNAT family N-acetyltransferase n=1 Tax=Neolewinella agarilytica TaxID=478744 RepID=UPI002355DA9A|nr:GNAT family protein [Neolewinella agarilytica]